MNTLELSPSQADLSGPTANDSTAPEGLVFHYADEAKPLATPWQVAVERAKMVRKCGLPDGAILDPACGSGIQLAAYCAMISREGFGIEMDESTAKAVVLISGEWPNMALDNHCYPTIKIGDGTIGESEISMLHSISGLETPDSMPR